MVAAHVALARQRADLTGLDAAFGEAARSMLLGSISQELVYHATCPLLVVRPATWVG